MSAKAQKQKLCRICSSSTSEPDTLRGEPQINHATDQASAFFAVDPDASLLPVLKVDVNDGGGVVFQQALELVQVASLETVAELGARTLMRLADDVEDYASLLKRGPAQFELAQIVAHWRAKAAVRR